MGREECVSATAGTRFFRRGSRLVGLATCAAVLGAATVIAAPNANADTLSSLRDNLKGVQAAQENAQSEVDESRNRVNSATSALLESQERLEAAQSALAGVRAQLSAAQERHKELKAELAQARIKLEAAKAEVARGEAEVAAQQQVIAQAARESYQQRTDLQGLAVVFDSRSTADLSQRIQWNTTIFDTQAAEKARLDALLAQLEAARDEQQRIEQQVAQDEAAAADVVVQISSLERAAAEHTATVAELVAANEKARSAAASELATDEANYQQYRSDEQRLQREIEQEVARLKAEEARAAAAEAAKAAASKVSRAASGSSSGASTSVSTSGFIRPINASPGSRFGMRFHPILKYWRMHNGVDYGAATGTPIRAAKAGTVVKAGPNGGFGNFVLLGHGTSGGTYVTTGYAHMSRVAVSVGQRVEQGQVIGYVGSTGLSTTPHLHLEVRLDGVPVNPLNYIP